MFADGLIFGFSFLDLGHPTLRLLRVWPAKLGDQKQANAVMSRSHQLAITDGYTQIQFGRDVAPPGTDVPRIRLKEMEVSKLHATVYWDEDRKLWAIVDMGSKHGTFIRSGQPLPTPSDLVHGPGASTSADSRGHRLSSTRMSSMPRALRHFDELSLGSTTFIVHLHEDQLPCEACSSKGGDEIPLFYVSKAMREREATGKRKRDANEPPPPSQGDAKKSLTMLKRSMLSRHSAPVQGYPDGPRPYLDRSARRRALHPSTPDASVGASISTPPSRPITPPALEPVSAPPTPLSSSNIGHRLLMKQGWTPGTTLGPESSQSNGGSTALAEPIQVSVRTARVGLGVAEQPSAAQSDRSWKEEGKRRRWADVQSG